MAKINDVLRSFDGKRRQWSRGLERYLLHSLSNSSTHGKSHFPDAVRQILVVRSTNRIGNTVFLLPFLSALREQYPEADIDLVLNSRMAEPFLEGLLIRRIYQVNFHVSRLGGSLPSLNMLRHNNYDLLFAPFSSSTDHLLAAWARARHKLGFVRGESEQLFDASFADNSDFHYAHHPLRLLGRTAPPAVDECLPVLSGHKDEHPLLVRLKARYPNRHLVGFFTGARKGKGMLDGDWLTLLAKIRTVHPDALFIQLQDPRLAEPLLGDRVVQLHSLSELAQFTSRLSLFIACDTGPLHLAAASGVPCLGLFTKTAPERYGCLGSQHYSQRVTDCADIHLDWEWLSQVLTTPMTHRDI